MWGLSNSTQADDVAKVSCLLSAGGEAMEHLVSQLLSEEKPIKLSHVQQVWVSSIPMLPVSEVMRLFLLDAALRNAFSSASRPQPFTSCSRMTGTSPSSSSALRERLTKSREPPNLPCLAQSIEARILCLPRRAEVGRNFEEGDTSCFAISGRGLEPVLRGMESSRSGALAPLHASLLLLHSTSSSLSSDSTPERVPSYSSGSARDHALQQEMNKMLEKGTVDVVHNQVPAFYS